MKTRAFTLGLVLASWVAIASAGDPTAAKENVFETKPLGIKVSIKMIGPYTQPADLQIICLFKHKSSGDTYQGAAKETDTHLGGILSELRNRGEFVGELGETFLFAPPSDTIPAKRFMVIGLGDEKDLCLNSLKVVGRIAAREAVRLKATHVAWAPVIRDEGNTTIESGALELTGSSASLAGNLIDDGRKIRIIDWEYAGPVDLTWDLAHTAWLNAQLHDDDVAERNGLGNAEVRARQLGLFFDGYRLSSSARVGLIDKMIEFAVYSAADEAIQGNLTPESDAFDASGYPVLWAVTWRVRSASWMLRHKALLEREIRRQ